MNRKQRRAALKGNVSPAVGEAEALNRRGLALAGQGGGDDARFLGEAAELFRQACRHHPTFAEAYNNLGASRHRQGRHAEAAEACRNALTLKPDDASALYNLALALNAMGRLEDAAACYRKALTVRPDDPSTLNNLGIALSALNRPDEAETVFLSLLPLRADDPEAYNNLGAALAAQGKFDQGMTAYKTAITLRPHYVEAHTNLSSALFEQGQFALAAKAARTALAFQPESTVAHNNLGVALQAMGRLREAERAFRTAISLDPDFSEAHYDLAITLLQGGFFPEGWREHEWRWSGAVENLTPRQFPQPRWAGEPLAGRTILFYAEQGMGDILQFARYTSCLAALGGRVILEVYRPLVRLLTSVPGAAQVVAIGDPLPAFDVHLPLMSAPHLLGTTVQNIPTDIPYVHPDDALATVWKNRLSGLTGLKVGVVWSGDPRPDNPRAHAVDRRRSLSLSQLEPLLAMPGVSFVSLQKGSPAAQLTTVAPEIRPLDRMDDVSDFADTAALVANLDLVISVDTSVAHLAGALGKPVWILSRFDGCWRWLTDRDDSPWYPTARLFRQETPGEWKNVVARVAAALEKHMLTVTPGLDPGVHTPPPSQTPHPHNDGNTRIKSGNDETRFETGATINAAFDEALQHHQAGRLDDAETLYRLSIANDPQHARSHYNLGLIALQRGRHETAVEKIRQALDLHPANPEAWTNLGIALQALGRLEDAIVAFHASLDQCPDDARVHYNLAIALGLSGKHQDAIPSFLSAITLNPALDEAYNNLAVAMVSLGRNEDAIPAFQRAIVLHPDDADTRFNLGMALHCLDRVKEAATAFQATTEINPLRAEAHGALGAMHLQMGNPVETERACRRAITLAPDNASARSNLAA
ncbi:MAG TPA: tetratricopeptide repeat protein, partial [Telmatospirillum sp.]|nr:tetratricopeptide repeat protein [Telmatospirillum sp.]